MVFESPCRSSSRQIPQSESLVPRTREGVVTIRGQYYITDEVRVTIQTLLGYTIVGLVSGQFPYDQSPVCNVNKIENM